MRVFCAVARRSGLHASFSWLPMADMMRYVQYAATMLPCTRPERGFDSCTVGCTERSEMQMQSARLTEMKTRLSVHPGEAKKAYMTPVSAIATTNMPAVELMRIHCQRFELLGEFSQFSTQVSDHECAKSTRRTRPSRMNIVAPIRET